MNYQIIQLSDIDISKLRLVKESTSWINERDHCRWVFRDDSHAAGNSRQTRYLKIWNPKHVRRNNVLNALESGFYDETTASALTGIIFHKGVCRGYITEPCFFDYRTENEFYEILKKKTITCNFFAIQFSRYHVGLCNGKYSLIDLEGVHPIKDLPKMRSLHAFFDHTDYGRFVTSRFLTLYPGRYGDLDNRYSLKDDSWKSKLRKFSNALYPTRMLLLWQCRFRQRMKIKLCSTHTHLIEF